MAVFALHCILTMFLWKKLGHSLVIAHSVALGFNSDEITDRLTFLQNAIGLGVVVGEREDVMEAGAND